MVHLSKASMLRLAAAAASIAGVAIPLAQLPRSEVLLLPLPAIGASEVPTSPAPLVVPQPQSAQGALGPKHAHFDQAGPSSTSASNAQSSPTLFTSPGLAVILKAINGRSTAIDLAKPIPAPTTPAPIQSTQVSPIQALTLGTFGTLAAPTQPAISSSKVALPTTTAQSVSRIAPSANHTTATTDTATTGAPLASNTLPVSSANTSAKVKSPRTTESSAKASPKQYQKSVPLAPVALSMSSATPSILGKQAATKDQKSSTADPSKNQVEAQATATTWSANGASVHSPTTSSVGVTTTTTTPTTTTTRNQRRPVSLSKLAKLTVQNDDSRHIHNTAHRDAKRHG